MGWGRVIVLMVCGQWFFWWYVVLLGGVFECWCLGGGMWAMVLVVVDMWGDSRDGWWYVIVTGGCYVTGFLVYGVLCMGFCVWVLCMGFCVWDSGFRRFEIWEDFEFFPVVEISVGLWDLSFRDFGFLGSRFWD